MARKKITIEDLALMVKRGFDETTTKEDLERFATKQDLERFATKEDLQNVKNGLERKMDEGFYAVNTRIDLLRNDISDLPQMREELHDLRNRVSRLEKKTSIAK